MPYEIENILVVAVLSNALFDLKKEDKFFRKQELRKYRRYQIENFKKSLKQGVAFSFVQKPLHLNKLHK